VNALHYFHYSSITSNIPGLICRNTFFMLGDEEGALKQQCSTCDNLLGLKTTMFHLWQFTASFILFHFREQTHQNIMVTIPFPCQLSGTSRKPQIFRTLTNSQCQAPDNANLHYSYKKVKKQFSKFDLANIFGQNMANPVSFKLCRVVWTYVSRNGLPKLLFWCTLRQRL